MVGDCSHVVLGCELLDRQVDESGHKSTFHHVSGHFAVIFLWML